MDNPEAFGEFYRQTAPALRNYVARVMGRVADADDIVQEAYVRLLRHPPAIDDPQELRRYVFRVASNLITDRWRRRKREAPASEAPEAVAKTRDAVQRLDMERTFRQLRARDRQLLWLAYVEGASHRDIAAVLGLAERSIKVLLSRARATLASLLRDQGHGGGGSK